MLDLQFYSLFNHITLQFLSRMRRTICCDLFNFSLQIHVAWRSGNRYTLQNVDSNALEALDGLHCTGKCPMAAHCNFGDILSNGTASGH